jgi:CheY-like chemotaxis protein
MDVQMPIMDGMSATRTIRAVEWERRDNVRIPIIALTAHASESDRAHCLASGMDAHLAKPYKPNDLLSLIQQFSNRSLTT